MKLSYLKISPLLLISIITSTITFTPLKLSAAKKTPARQPQPQPQQNRRATQKNRNVAPAPLTSSQVPIVPQVRTTAKEAQDIAEINTNREKKNEQYLNALMAITAFTRFNSSGSYQSAALPFITQKINSILNSQKGLDDKSMSEAKRRAIMQSIQDDATMLYAIFTQMKEQIPLPSNVYDLLQKMMRGEVIDNVVVGEALAGVLANLENSSIINFVTEQTKKTASKRNKIAEDARKVLFYEFSHIPEDLNNTNFIFIDASNPDLKALGELNKNYYKAQQEYLQKVKEMLRGSKEKKDTNLGKELSVGIK